MLAAAPDFRQLAPSLYERLELLERDHPEHYRIFARHLGKRRVHAVDLAA